MIDDAELTRCAMAVAVPRRLSPTLSVGSVGCALLTPGNRVFVGVCIDAPCGIGFCAEHAAIAAMVSAGESRIASIVAVEAGGRILPPCGRCRELMWQLGEGAAATRVLLGAGRSVALRDLLPEPWVPGER